MEGICGILSQLRSSLEEEKAVHKVNTGTAPYDWFFKPWTGDPYCSKKRWGVLLKSILLRVRNWTLVLIAISQFPKLHYQNATLIGVAGMELVGAFHMFVLYRSRRYNSWDDHMWEEHSRGNLPGGVYRHIIDPGIVDGA